MVAAGHRVETHGHEHVTHHRLSGTEIKRDLETGLSVLADIGVHPARWRPPYGETAAATSRADARETVALVEPLVTSTASARSSTTMPTCSIRRTVICAMVGMRPAASRSAASYVVDLASCGRLL